MDRREAVARFLAGRGDALLITGLGSPSYDAHAAGDRADNFYLWGAMGAAALMGLGLAQARPDRRVIALAARLGAPAEGPRLFVLEIAAESPPRSLPPRDGVWLKNRFRAALGLGVN